MSKEIPKGRADELASDATTADALLAAADARGLRNLLKVSHDRERQTMDVLVTLMALYSDKAVTRMPDDPSGIEAMRDVALAAIKVAERAFNEPTP